MVSFNGLIGKSQDIKVGDLLFVYGRFFPVVEVNPLFHSRPDKAAEVRAEVEDPITKKTTTVFFDPAFHVVVVRPEKK